MRDWKIDETGPFPLGEGSIYALVCVDTMSDQRFFLSPHEPGWSHKEIRETEYHVWIPLLDGQ